MKPAPHHNGNIERVFKIVRAGFHAPADIERVTGLDRNAVSNALRRLVDKKRIYRSRDGHYTVTGPCALAQAWK